MLRPRDAYGLLPPLAYLLREHLLQSERDLQARALREEGVLAPISKTVAVGATSPTRPISAAQVILRPPVECDRVPVFAF